MVSIDFILSLILGELILKSVRKFLSVKVVSYRNQSVDFYCKSMEWFLYDMNFLLKSISEQTSMENTSQVPLYSEFFIAMLIG